MVNTIMPSEGVLLFLGNLSTRCVANIPHAVEIIVGIVAYFLISNYTCVHVLPLTVDIASRNYCSPYVIVVTGKGVLLPVTTCMQNYYTDT